MAEILEQSLKSLLIKLRASGMTLGTATGFIADSPAGPVLVTNLHCVTGRNPDTGAILHKSGLVPDELEIVHNRLGRRGEWVTRVETLYANSQPRWIEHPTLGSKVDCVALPLSQTLDVGTSTYDPGNTGDLIQLRPADIVSVIGFPFGLTGGGSYGIWATGFVATEPSINFDDLPMMLVDCRARQGQSGSAVIAYRSGGVVLMESGNYEGGATLCRFIGIYSGRVNKESDLGRVWKASAIAEIITAIK